MKRLTIGLIWGALLLSFSAAVALAATINCVDTSGICMGTANSDTITGEAGVNDEIWAGSGNDKVQGLSGDDTIYGQKGNDLIEGNGGADTLQGNADDDDVYGNAGNDTINGNDGNDDLVGGAGDDLIGGGAGRDAIDLATGDQPGDEDEAFGGPDRDVIYAQDGELDTIHCGSGFDTVAADEDDVVDSDCEEVLEDPIDIDDFFGEKRFNLTF